MADGIENEIDSTNQQRMKRKGTKLQIYRDYSSTNKLHSFLDGRKRVSLNSECFVLDSTFLV
jgi:hypothetical protein